MNTRAHVDTENAGDGQHCDPTRQHSWSDAPVIIDPARNYPLSMRCAGDLTNPNQLIRLPLLPSPCLLSDVLSAATAPEQPQVVFPPSVSESSYSQHTKATAILARAELTLNRRFYSYCVWTRTNGGRSNNGSKTHTKIPSVFKMQLWTLWEKPVGHSFFAVRM